MNHHRASDVSVVQVLERRKAERAVLAAVAVLAAAHAHYVAVCLGEVVPGDGR